MLSICIVTILHSVDWPHNHIISFLIFAPLLSRTHRICQQRGSHIDAILWSPGAPPSARAHARANSSDLQRRYRQLSQRVEASAAPPQSPVWERRPHGHQGRHGCGRVVECSWLHVPTRASIDGSLENSHTRREISPTVGQEWADTGCN